MSKITLLSRFSRQPGPLTIVNGAAQTLLQRWVPKWHEVFADPATGLYFERVGPAFKPILTGRRRLLSQLRQLAMYSHAVASGQTFLFSPDLKCHVDTIFAQFKTDAPGAWILAVSDTLGPADETRDLYTLAFYIFAMAHYASATGDVRAQEQALLTAHYIDKHMRADSGFAETTAGQMPRRHESHMHFLEACLAATAVWDAPIFLRLADELVHLFVTRLYDSEQNILSEYFTADLRPTPDPACGKIICEAGHYYEWVWLLKKFARIKGQPEQYDQICVRLLDWANTHGWDAEFGGIFDELDSHGNIVSDRKRLWPLTEGLKANALLLDTADVNRDAIKTRIAAMAELLAGKYIQQRGFWSEWLARDLTPQADYMPATTPYHVYFGIMESREALKQRGQSKSWRAAPWHFIYAWRRRLSALVRAARLKKLG